MIDKLSFRILRTVDFVFSGAAATISRWLEMFIRLRELQVNFGYLVHGYRHYWDEDPVSMITLCCGAKITATKMKVKSRGWGLEELILPGLPENNLTM